MEKMTKKEMYDFIASAMSDNADVVTFCENEIALLDKKAAKAKETAAAKKADGDALRDTVQAVLTSDPQVIADIAAQIEGDDVSVAKITYRLTSLVKAGIAVKSEVTVPATETSKARKIAAYALVG